LSSVKKGLFVNCRQAQDSIFESGLMVYNCLKYSDQYNLDYQEIDVENRSIKLGYDFYFFNYHPATMSWLQTSKLKKELGGLVITMILEILPNDPFVMCPDSHFHGYCVLDPTIKSRNKKVYSFPRPLEEAKNLPDYVPNEIPVIGSFGFATKGKGFTHVVDAVNKEFDKAIVKINIPYGDFVPNSDAYAKRLSDLCKQRAKKGIEVIVTHDYMSKDDLIKWCRSNTLNCFLYDRQMPGLAATTDQAISAARPLSVSNNETFRHILAYVPGYPKASLKESIEKSLDTVLQMQKDWSPDAFKIKFEKMLGELEATTPVQKKGTNELFLLPLSRKNFLEIIAKRYRKYKRYLSVSKLQYELASRKKKKTNAELI